MNVAIDARWIFPAKSGIGVYTAELVRRLPALAPNDSFLLFFSEPAVRDRTLAETGLGAAPNVRALLVPYGVFSLRSQLQMPRLLARHEVAVFHSPNYMIPFAAFRRRRDGATACVATIHDVIPLVIPDHAPKSRKTRLMPLYRRVMREVARRADAIVTVSRCSRADVIRHLRVPPEDEARVKVVYDGVSERFTPPRERRAKGPSDPRTILYVGRSDPYKNLPLLVDALARARRDCPFPLRLCIAGSPDPRYPEADEAAARFGVADHVTWTGPLDEPSLVAHYQGADVLVHPSRYEGFGLQVAEAMACGLPVICSNAASLPEVAGGAALLLGPDDVEGYAAAVVKVLTQSDQAEAMRREGLRQAALFSWHEAARQTLAIYRSVHAARQRR